MTTNSKIKTINGLPPEAFQAVNEANKLLNDQIFRLAGVAEALERLGLDHLATQVRAARELARDARGPLARYTHA